MIFAHGSPRNAIATSNAFSPKTGWSEWVRRFNNRYRRLFGTD
jgi:hypothetical protein